jgi:polyphosphate kinase
VVHNPLATRTSFGTKVNATGASGRYINRELSWLDFNGRVLAMASDPRTPLLERVKFCAIFAGNLDEFYEVRVAGLKDQVAAGITSVSIDGLRPREQLKATAEAVRELASAHADLFANTLRPALAAEGIEIVEYSALNAADVDALEEVFLEGIFPVLTPLAVDPGHPFPYISNLSLNLAVMVRDRNTGDARFARVKIPPLLPRFIPLADGRRWVTLEQVIAANLHALFPGMEIDASYAFRVTRNADLALEESEADDLLAAVETELRRRRFGRAVRLEIVAEVPDEIIDMLREELELRDDDILRLRGPIDLTGLFTIATIDRPELKDDRWAARTQHRLRENSDGEVDFFEVISKGDVLVHHPYDSFVTSVERFISQAATDPNVLTIKLTLYRTSGDSPVVKALIEAAERGKQVVALVELKARFDEQANIAWARKLEQAGVHVVYGLVGLKTHTKVALVVRGEPEGIRRYVHISTGNYNPSTARVYEDIGVFSNDPDLGSDLTMLFNSLTGFSQPAAYRKLIVAPKGMREKIIDLIQNEHPNAQRGAGSVVLKMNSLNDRDIIEALYVASGLGVKIDLIVRGICCLRPGVPGLSENIRVRSVVGRFLEHSRVWRFANGAGEGKPQYFIGSADMMPRNLDGRVEAIVPVTDLGARRHLDYVIETLLSDTRLAWTLDAQGSWTKVEAVTGVAEELDAHRQFQHVAITRAELPA